MKTPIGGFFELEIAGGDGPYHTSASPLCSGRACLRRILELMRPSRVWVPFYVCDAVFQALTAAGVATELYSIDEAFDPLLPAGSPAGGEGLVYVNYFGLKTSTAASLVGTYPDQVIVDDTQSFFTKGYPGGWSFNSARKFFGVPDGGYAYGGGLLGVEYPRVPKVHYGHLVSRLLGHQDLAYEQYRQSEARVTVDIWRMSVLSERLLASIDYAVVRDRRRRNFAALHEAFAMRNCLTSLLAPDAGEVPYCYPLSTAEPVRWNDLWSRGIFVPRLWPQLSERAASRQFARESMLAERLLPLPIDHRYTPEDLDGLVHVVNEVMRW
jgi:hypothetical protein